MFHKIWRHSFIQSWQWLVPKVLTQDIGFPCHRMSIQETLEQMTRRTSSGAVPCGMNLMKWLENESTLALRAPGGLMLFLSR